MIKPHNIYFHHNDDFSARRRGRPKKTWSECVKADMKMCSLGSINPLNKEAWGLGVSSRKMNSGSSKVKTIYLIKVGCTYHCTRKISVKILSYLPYTNV